MAQEPRWKGSSKPTCGYSMFEETAVALMEYKGAIINSFVMFEPMDRNGITIRSRLSNGPMESLNRVPKDMKRHARGYGNFDHIRNRFLYAMRPDASISACPKTAAEVKQHTGRKRGAYKKGIRCTLRGISDFS